MACSDFIILEDEYRKLLRDLIDSNSRVGYDIIDRDTILYLSPDSIDDVISKNRVSMALKNLSFADDDIIIYVYNNGKAEWYQFQELEGDGHIKIHAKKINIDGIISFYVEFAYTSFFLRRDGSHIDPHPNLIRLYKKLTRSIRLYSTSEVIWSVRKFNVSNRIRNSGENWRDNIKIALES